MHEVIWGDDRGRGGDIRRGRVNLLSNNPVAVADQGSFVLALAVRTFGICLFEPWPPPLADWRGQIGKIDSAVPANKAGVIYLAHHSLSVLSVIGILHCIGLVEKIEIGAVIRQGVDIAGPA